MLQSCAVSTLQIGSTPPKRSRCSSMNATSAVWPVELGREESRRGLEDLVRPLELGDLLLQRLDLRGFLRCRPGPGAGVDLVPADPLAQRLGGADAELGRDALIAASVSVLVDRGSTRRTARSRSSVGYGLGVT